MNQHPPPLESPYGPNSWRQPPADRFLIDDTHAVCRLEDFQQLHEYSCSTPTGVYPGKMWRRLDGAFAPGPPLLVGQAKPRVCTWMLCWYGPVDDAKCSINYREVLFV